MHLWEVAGGKPCAIRVQENRLCKLCASRMSPRILCKLVQGFLDRFITCFFHAGRRQSAKTSIGHPLSKQRSRSRIFEPLLADFPCLGFPRHISTTAAADGWREGCLRTGARTATQRAVACRRGRREAVSVTAPQPVDAQDDVIFNEPGRRARVARGDGGDSMPRVHAERDTALGRLWR